MWFTRGYLVLHSALLRVNQWKTAHRLASTIYALSSGQGKCGIAVLRVTGKRAADVFTSMTVPASLPSPRVATLRRIVHPVTGESLDRGLVLWFPGPHSFTGEDSCELHVHGGPAVIAAVLSALSILPGYKLAQAGDFTKRAFYHGKLDLTSVEGLGDLIHAETEAQRKLALRQMEGVLAQLYNRWRQTLLQCRAGLEAYIDFSEDENISEGILADIEVKICKLIQELKCHLGDDRRGERLRSGLQLTILGRPNVGKSSFLNILTQRPAAIVSPIPGTTRDVVESSLDLGGYPVIISDTAGLRQTEDIIEVEGVKRAQARARHADAAVIILEALEVLQLVKKKDFDWNTFLSNYFKELGIYECENSNSRDNFPAGISLQWIQNKNYLTLINKVDLIECAKDRNLLASVLKDSCILLSVKTQEGFTNVLQKLKHLCASMCEVGTAENPTLTSARHRAHISACLEALTFISSGNKVTGAKEMLEHSVSENNQKASYGYHQSSLSFNGMNVVKGSNSDITQESSLELIDKVCGNLLHSEDTIVVAAHYLHQAATSLGYVTGSITTDDVLDHIFSAFCIGK
ncbi:tRNA modification GTPase GTPBP3, mitochondrial isoform X1 [Cherax quadricarinatus]|uniref:tRNA modification GTPase GTPBP3, mitochondrial isoform X1 n=1 Tax=Cherax quadricarinatus TaxID=27406 RepID=UPI00387E34D0